VFKENLPLLKHLHCIAVSRGKAYPNMTWFDFALCCETCGFLDRTIKLSTLDRVFIASDVEAAKVGGNSKLLMNRYEFFEALVRISDMKFK
jgi:hypothetical protein